MTMYAGIFHTVPSAAPDNVIGRVVNSRSVLLFWMPPSEDTQNGDIIYYTIILMGDEKRDYLISYNFTVNSTSMELSTLWPYSQYNVTVAANTIVGMGPFSAPYTFYTPEEGIMYVG